MMRSMFSAVSGLRSHQTYMDVVGNNIANVNTTGFKASRVAFQDMLSQTIRPAGAASPTRGGVNPLQIGLGTVVSNIDTVQTQGSMQSTGKPTDLALEGDGFFVLGSGARQYYTRDGAFDQAIDGSLVNTASGLKVMGWQATNGVVDTTGPLVPILLPLGQGMKASASANLAIAGNLPSTTAVGETITTDVTVRDSLGNPHALTVTFTRVAGTNTWTWQAASATTPADPTITAITPTGTSISFDANGQIVAPTSVPTLSITFNNGADPVAIDLDLANLTQLSGSAAVTATADGSAAGSLSTFTIDNTGTIVGVYSNGVQEVLGQIALAKFANPSGLVKAGGNLLSASVNSGAPELGPAGTGGHASISSGFLEMSNVDLAQQFTNMIMAERGFQANSRVISASNEILQDLVNLIR